MRFKNLEQIIEVIKNPKNRSSIERARKLQEKNYLHITGLGLISSLIKVEGLESEKLIEIRKQLAKPATVPIMSELLLPINKVFTADGGVKWLGLKETEKDKFDVLLSDVKKGMSIDNYMYKIWKPNINLEPSSIAYLEVSSKDQSLIPKPYITHKSIFDIYDIDYSGINVDYIIFEPKLEDNGDITYRVVDDGFDMTIIKKTSNNKELYTLDEEQLYPNPFNMVPALAYSNRLDSLSEAKISYINESIPLADEYLFDFTIYTIYKHKLGFPYVAQYPSVCPECNGVGKIDNKECKRCNGQGEAISRDVSDIIIKPIPQKDDPQLGNIAEYVQPDLDTWTKMEETQELFKSRIWSSTWGDSLIKIESKSAKTAFEINVREDSKYTKLDEISENREIFEKKLIDLYISFYKPDYEGSFIKSGRIYIQKSTNDLWKEYNEAVKNGLANHILDKKYLEAIKSEYRNSPKELDRAEKLFRAEPYPHISLKDISSVNPTSEEILIKKLFQKYIFRYESEFKGIYYSTDNELQSKLLEYAKKDIPNIKVNQSEVSE